MALFDEHLAQAKKNLQFLEVVNQSVQNYYDWQVTICFYTALHIVNAHLSHNSLQYRQHKDVNYALNPHVVGSISKLPEDEYDAYMGLQRLSRRSRYLVNEKDGNVTNPNAFFTYEKHLARAVRNLDKILVYFNQKYNLNLKSISFSCAELRKEEKFSLLILK